jgi:hypothetical protein
MSSVTVLWMHPGRYPALSLRARVRLRELHGLPSGASRYQMASPKWQAMQFENANENAEVARASRTHCVTRPPGRTATALFAVIFTKIAQNARDISFRRFCELISAIRPGIDWFWRF